MKHANLRTRTESTSAASLIQHSDKADMANAKPEQEISVEGQTFRAIIRLTTRG